MEITTSGLLVAIIYLQASSRHINTIILISIDFDEPLFIPLQIIFKKKNDFAISRVDGESFYNHILFICFKKHARTTRPIFNLAQCNFCYSVEWLAN